MHEENIWLTQKKMAELFSVQIPTINEHLKNIFKSGELGEDSVIRKFLTTASDGKNYMTKYYNLNAIISVGYRVNSKQATHFRIWAMSVLKEYVIKGFAMDDDRLKNGQYFDKDYFNEFKVLDNKGKISFKEAEKKAFKEYEVFNKIQKTNSDFDEFSKKLLDQS